MSPTAIAPPKAAASPANNRSRASRILDVDASAIPSARKVLPPRSGTIRTVREDDLKPIPPTGEWYPLFTLDGRPVTPPEALAAVEAGATFSDLDRAHATVDLLAARARLPYAPLPAALDSNRFPFRTADDDDYEPLPAGAYVKPYADVLAAARAKVAAAKRAQAVESVDALLDAHGGRLPDLLVASEVAGLLRIAESSVYRLAGSVLPGAVQIGSRKFWRSEAILRHLGQL